MHGSAFHFAIEEYELSGRALSADDCKQLFFDHYDKAIAEALEKEPEYANWMTGGHKKGENDIADRRVKGASQVDIYIDYAEAHADEWRIYPIGPKGVGVELEFNVEFGGVMVKGFIDQVRQYADGRLMPVDLKSGTKEPVSAFQLAVYAQVINEYVGVLPESGSFFMPKLKQNGSLVGDVYKDLSPWTRPLIDRMFSDFDKAERAGIYIPSPGDMCRVCGVKESCSVMGDPEQRVLFETIRVRGDAA